MRPAALLSTLLLAGLLAAPGSPSLAGASSALPCAVSDAPSRPRLPLHSSAAGAAEPSTAHAKRELLGLALADPCAGVTCPAGALCRNQGGAATCTCPAARPHMVNRQCTAGALPNAEYLDPHNYARAALGLASLTWNASLAASALAWARTLATCDLHHPPGVPYGQNLASVWGTTTAQPVFGINLWINEAADYTYAVYPGGCQAGKMCGHYTQLMWANTRQVGCAQAPCSKAGSAGIVWACDYFPPGNYLGQLPYVQDPCSRVRCPGGSRCTSTTGAAVCSCPAGLALVNNVCRADPCRAHTCPGNRVCNAATGIPQCVCSPGMLPAQGNPNLCQSPLCSSVRCPARATCRAVNAVPVCSCPSGTSMLNNACVAGALPSSTTSLALYPLPGFRGVPVVIRVSKGCTALPPALQGRVRSASVVWNARDPGAARGSATCQNVFFWNEAGCYGEGWGPVFTAGQILTQYSDTMNATSNTYAPKAAAGVSVSC